MPKLPFVVEPKAVETLRVGNTDIGELEIKKLNDLAPNERRWIRELTKELPNLQKEAVKLAQAIATQTGDSVTAVYEALTTGRTDILENHLETVLSFQEMMSLVGEQRQLIYATAILRFRVCDDWELEHTGDANLIHPALATEVASFAFKEEAHWAQPEEEAAELTEEDLGK